MIIEDLVKKINKIKTLTTKEVLTQKDYEDLSNQQINFQNDKPKIYNHKNFIDEMSNFQSTLVAYKNKTISDHEYSKL